jgi:hypothetical protein
MHCSEFHEWLIHLNTKHRALYSPYIQVPDPSNFSNFLKLWGSAIRGWKSTTSTRTSLYMHSHVSLHNTENNFCRASAEGRLGGGSDAPYACSARLGPAYVSIRQHTSAYISRRRRCALHLQRPLRPCIRQHTSAYISRRKRCTLRLQRPLRPCIRQHT